MRSGLDQQVRIWGVHTGCSNRRRETLRPGAEGQVVVAVPSRVSGRYYCWPNALHFFYRKGLLTAFVCRLGHLSFLRLWMAGKRIW